MMIRRARNFMFLTLATALGALALTFTGAPDAAAGTAEYKCSASTYTPSECKAVYNRFKNNGVRVWGYHAPNCTPYFCYDGYFYYSR